MINAPGQCVQVSEDGDRSAAHPQCAVLTSIPIGRWSACKDVTIASGALPIASGMWSFCVLGPARETKSSTIAPRTGRSDTRRVPAPSCCSLHRGEHPSANQVREVLPDTAWGVPPFDTQAELHV